MKRAAVTPLESFSGISYKTCYPMAVSLQSMTKSTTKKKKKPVPSAPLGRTAFRKRHLIPAAFFLPMGTFLNVSLRDTLEMKALDFSLTDYLHASLCRKGISHLISA